MERYTYNLARPCGQGGAQALVVTSALPACGPRDRRRGHRDHPAAGVAADERALPGAAPGREFKRLAALLWGRRIDFCLINTRFYVSSLYAARQAARRRIPAIVVDHSTGHLPMNSALLNAAARPMSISPPAFSNITACGFSA